MTNATENFVPYYRVSTQRQGKSGLGLEAQQEAVRHYIAGVRGEIVGEFTEVESGKRTKNRPALKKALALAKQAHAVLIVAKLDRLARNVAFVSRLLETQVQFRAADFPSADRMMIQILSVFAEYEARCVSQRTKAACAMRRARGDALGNPQNFAQYMVRRRRQSLFDAGPAVELIRQHRAAGMTQEQIAAALNAAGLRTKRGAIYRVAQVGRILKRIRKEAGAEIKRMRRANGTPEIVPELPPESLIIAPPAQKKADAGACAPAGSLHAPQGAQPENPITAAPEKQAPEDLARRLIDKFYGIVEPVEAPPESAMPDILAEPVANVRSRVRPF